jgi:uncharacterized protein
MERIYRDPVHNIIALSDERADDALLMKLVDTPEFQRLRHIKQLGLALFTYQGAEHSRFTHALGVMHLMTRVLDRLARRHSISPEARVVARAAALLHDLGHGPFSHVIEKALAQNHEEWTARIISDPGTCVHALLASFHPDLPQQVVAAIEHRYSPSFVGQLVSSQLDVDRLDYLLRDSLMTGAKYGNYDLEWIIQALEVDEENDRIYVSSNGLYAIEEYLQARYYMFRQVYFHRTLRSAEVILKCILRRAVRLAQAGSIGFLLPGSVMEMVLTEKQLTVSDYLAFDDHDIIFHIKQWAHDGDAILSDLCRRFLQRRLFKVRDLEMPEAGRKSFVAHLRDSVVAAGFDPDYYLIEDRASDIPYYSYYRPEGRGRLYIERTAPAREICDIADVSAVVRGMRGYEIRRICFPAELTGQFPQC